MENQSTYRIRTTLGDTNPVTIPVSLMQEYNSFEILSLKVNTDDTYRSYTSPTGMVIGRVSTANNGLGIPNVRVSIFVPKETYDQSDEEEVLYPFSSPTDTDTDRVRYNLLPSDSDVSCYQVVGTMPTKRKILDNETVCDVFDKYYKYTTITNEAGDFMLSEIPVGKQRIHIDADLSDIGPFLSQKPYDMIENLGYSKDKFDSTRQFKTSKDLDSLVQILCQNKSVYVYPYWGDSTENSSEMKITRTDLSLNYEFKTSAVFIGSVVTDKQSNSIKHNCASTKTAGKMSDLVTGPGRIEMIRKTIDNKVEQYRVKGDDLIDDNGVWCYQVPMNLDYVRTDEFGNIIPTDDPNKGIPTRARVRFRITINEMEDDNDKYKRCSYLVPNNPKTTDEKFLKENDADYSFGSSTWDESYVDMFWNKVYTVKNYIPRIQRSNKHTNQKHSGIKWINFYGDNNPFPYNNVSIKLPFQYRLICMIVKVIIYIVYAINIVLSLLGELTCQIVKFLKAIANIGILGVHPFKIIVNPILKIVEKLLINCISFSADFCDDGINSVKTYPGCITSVTTCVWEQSKKDCQEESYENMKNGEDSMICTTETSYLENCVETQLAQSNDATSFNFENDWINGCLYMPLWYRRIKPKRSYFFGLFKKKAKDEWCSVNTGYKNLYITSFCTLNGGYSYYSENYSGDNVEYHIPKSTDSCGDDCHEANTRIALKKGVVVDKENSYGQTVWYYRAVEAVASDNSSASEYVNDNENAMLSKTLYATDIVMLGSLNDCDLNGIPKFYNYLRASTFNMPTDILFTDTEYEYQVNEDGELEDVSYHQVSVSSGSDWGNKNEYGYKDGGLFYSIGCNSIDVDSSSCINLKRVCELGVGLDDMKYVENLTTAINSDEDELDYDNDDYYLRPDGFISYDDIVDFNYRSMFATMNGNGLKTKINTTNGVREYDFRHLYIDNFDGSLAPFMSDTLKGRTKANYRYNANLEVTNPDYLTFRMGDNPYYYDGKNLVSGDTTSSPGTYALPKYQNSFYFYFGLKEGKTAIDLFNQKYNGKCSEETVEEASIPYEYEANSWCHADSDDNDIYDHKSYDGYLKIDLEDVSLPCSIMMNSKTNRYITYTVVDIDGNTSVDSEKIYFGKSDTEFSTYTRYYLHYENSSIGVDVTGCYMLSNGEYTMYITDNEGNQQSLDINITKNKLTFEYEVTNFALDNKTLLSKYGSYGNVATSGTVGFSTEDSDSTPSVTRTDDDEDTTINGTICVYNIYSNYSQLQNFVITVEPYNDDTDSSNWEVSFYFYEGDLDEKKSSSTDYIDVEDSYYVIKCPKGGIYYKVTVAEICDGDDDYYVTNNSVYYRVLVDEPTEYKLFINGVDYDIIKNFTTGWTLSTIIDLQTSSPSGSSNLTPYSGEPSISDIKGWLYINDINNEYYDWSADSDTYGDGSITTNTDNEGCLVINDKYVVEDKDGNAIYDEDPGEGNDGHEAWQCYQHYKNRLAFVEKMKSAFWLMSSDEEKSITFTVQTDDTPYDIWVMYNDEYTSEVYDNYNDYNETQSDTYKAYRHHWIYTGESTNIITGIKVPNITYRESEAFGNANDDVINTSYSWAYSSSGICFGQDNIAEESTDGGISIKPPYMVACVNNIGETKPEGLTENYFFVKSANSSGIKSYNFGNDGYGYLSYNGKEFFQFYIIDKIFSTDIVCWAYINNIPYYDKDHGGEYIKANGLVAGVVLNGVSSSVDSNGYVSDFEDAEVFGDTVRLMSYSNDDENSIPTHRCILPSSDNDYSTYPKYVHTTQVGNEKQYVEVPNLTGELSFVDSVGYTTTETLYGAMSIEINSSSISNSYDDSASILSVSLSNCDVDSGCMFYIICADGHEYPLNRFDDNTLKCGETDYWTGDNPVQLFNYNTKKSHIKACVDTDVTSSIVTTDTDGNEVSTASEGYGTTGIFMNLGNKPYYVICITKNNCRAISPVYDFAECYYRMTWEEAEDENVNEDSGDDSEGYGDYVLHIEIIRDDSYYLNYYLSYYDFTVEYDVKYNGASFVSGSFSHDADNKDYCEDQYINPTAFDTLERMERLFGNGMYKSNVYCYVTDITGLRHRCKNKEHDD